MTRSGWRGRVVRALVVPFLLSTIVALVPASVRAGVNPDASLLRNVRNCGSYRSPYHPGKGGCWWYRLDQKLEAAIPQICSLSRPKPIPRISNPNDPNYVGVYSGERGYVGVRIDWTIDHRFQELKRRWCTGASTTTTAASSAGGGGGGSGTGGASTATTAATGTSSASPPSVSGGRVTWRSGMHCWPPGGLKAIRDWRGVPVRVGEIFLPNRSWPSESNARRLAARHSKLAARMDVVLATPLLFGSARGDFAGCAAGRYDDRFRAFARGLVAGGLPRAYIRLAPEFQQDRRVRSDPANFVTCFRRAVSAMRSVAPGLRIEWSPARTGRASKARALVNRYWPGDRYVDAVNLSLYDFSPSARSEEWWKTWFQEELDWWASFARSKNIELNFGEWGLYHREDGFDNPIFIRGMFEFFSRNRDVIGYEIYFNCKGTRGRLYPGNWNPRAAETYRRLWRGR